MAEAPGLREKSLEELEEEVTCAVCHGHYQQAKLLPCMHYYCRACIEELAKRSRGRPFPCPECCKDTTLPSGGADQLQSAFFVERMKDVYVKMAKAEGKVEAVCEMCSGGKAVALCRRCAEFMCSDCTRSHQKMKMFANHKVSTLEDLKKGGAKDILVKEVPPPKCPEHDELMKIYCFDCNRLICRDCLLYDHHEHNSDFLKKCATENRKSLRNSLTALRRIQANILGADKKLVATEARVDAQEKEVFQTIKRSFTQLKAVLEQRETELLNKAATLSREKKDALTTQRKGLQMVKTEIQSLVEFVERNVENTSDQDLMVIRTQLQVKVEEEEKRHQQLSLEPATTADMAYDPPSPDAIPGDLGNVFHQPTPAVLGNVSACGLGHPMSVTIAAPNTQSTDIYAQLKSLVDPASSVQADIVQKGVGVYNITYTPRVRGRHDLMVKVNGKDIVGIPFRVFVKTHPTQLGPPVRTITGFSLPWGVALDNNQKLMVGEGDGKKVSVMERDGKRVQTIECDKFQYPRGVATGPDGAIYVTDVGAKCLFKFNNEGKLAECVQNELKCPLFIKTIKNRLYVSDRDSNLVKIFDTDCNVVGTIPTNECPSPYDIAEGDDGLYVVGDGNNKIGVCSCAPNGDFIRHLNIRPSSVKLSHPKGVCFDCSGHLFVTQSGSGVKGVYVFTPSGEQVASFGLACSGESEVDPAGIVIDEDGFVYVCDYWRHKIVVF